MALSARAEPKEIQNAIKVYRKAAGIRTGEKGVEDFMRDFGGGF